MSLSRSVTSIHEDARHQLGWRIAVLPFRGVGEPMANGIALGMAEEISAALSRFHAPRMIATATFWDGAGPVEDAFGRCRVYQLDYAIDGRIEVTDDHVLLTVSIFDVVLDFEAIWVGEFEGRLGDLYSLQNRVVSEVVAQIDPGMFHYEIAPGPLSKTQSAVAHRSVLTAMQGIFGLERRKFMSARDQLLQAIKDDPDYAAAYAWLAYWSIMAAGQGWVDSPREVMTSAGAAAECAISLDPLDARAMAIAGHVKAYLFHDVQGALECHARAISLNPNLPIAWTMSSWSRMYNGEHATAIRHATMALSLSPGDPHIFFVEHALMDARLFARELEEAALMSEIVLERQPGHVSALNVRLAILGHLNRYAEAAECLRALQTIDPTVSVERIAARMPLRPFDKLYYIDGLRRAGVPD